MPLKKISTHCSHRGFEAQMVKQTFSKSFKICVCVCVCVVGWAIFTLVRSLRDLIKARCATSLKLASLALDTTRSMIERL